MTEIQKVLLLNREVIGIDQQPVGGDCMNFPGAHCDHLNGGKHQIWVKPLQETTCKFTKGWSAVNVHRAIVLLNLDDHDDASISANLTPILKLCELAWVVLG